MVSSDDSGSIVGDGALDLHRLFGFSNTFDATVNDAAAQNENLPTCSSARPFKDLHTFSATGSADGLDAFSFSDFLALDESFESPLAAAKQASPCSSASPSPPDLAGCSPRKDPFPTSELAGGVSVAKTLKAAEAEIAQLKAALIADRLQQQCLTTPRDHQNSSGLSKWKSTAEGVYPPKSQIATKKRSIETLSSLTAAEDESHALYETLGSPRTPKVCPFHLEFALRSSGPFFNSAQDFDILPQDLQSIQNFLNSDLVHSSTSYHVDTSTSPSTIPMAHPLNGQAKRTPLKHALKPSHNLTTKTITKVKKKPKATTKETQHQRIASTTLIASPSPPIPPRYRSIDELLAANFYSLNEQEKTRILLPLLRNLHPRALESSLAGLPCVQAKCPSHEVRTSGAIRRFPSSLGADDMLASKLTFGVSPSSTPALRTVAISSPTSSLKASPRLREGHPRRSE